jgi:hypothetical protein
MDLRNHGAEPKFKIIANIAGIGSGGCALCLIRCHMLSLSKSFDSAAAQVSEKRNAKLFGGGDGGTDSSVEKRRRLGIGVVI